MAKGFRLQGLDVSEMEVPSDTVANRVLIVVGNSNLFVPSSYV
jgi:hypothetical protein